MAIRFSARARLAHCEDSRWVDDYPEDLAEIHMRFAGEVIANMKAEVLVIVETPAEITLMTVYTRCDCGDMKKDHLIQTAW